MHLHNVVTGDAMRARYPFMSLVSPMGGVVRSAADLPMREMHVPRFRSIVASLGNLTMAFPHVVDHLGNDLENSGLAGCGADEALEPAVVRAVAEAAERYATCVFDPRDVVTANFEEVGEDGIAWQSIPACSEAEYADPLCPTRPIDPAAAIRWIEGYSLTHRCRRLVPLVMTHLFVRAWPGERFWVPITTGVAAHTNLDQAMVSAILEVVERDAIALTWLLRLPLPRIAFAEDAPPPAIEKFARLRASGLRQLFFDATLDLGVPTVYGLQLKEGCPTAAQFVNCSTGFGSWNLCGKIIRESAMGRSMLEHGLAVPYDVRDFVALEHGAIFMGRPAQRPAFDFLLRSDRTVANTALDRDMPRTSREQLAFLVERFRALDMEIVLADIATDELRDAGLHVVRAIIPGLMPMTATYRARFLAHPRLDRVRARFAAEHDLPCDINPFPQPFA